MDVRSDTVFQFFVDGWWWSVTFHLVMYLVAWMTKTGRWSEIWGGDRD